MRIQELTLYTTQITKQSDFYTQVLGLTRIDESPKQVSFQIGASRLRFVKKEIAVPYHFAINIPANKEFEALAWLKERVDILKDGPFEIQNFNSWNAKAIYFYDRDHNIVELIARKNLNNNSSLHFDGKSFLEISEIGLPTIDIKSEFDLLNTATGIKIFDGSFERFCAVGNENGLFILVNKNVKNWFPTNDKAGSSDFDLWMMQNESSYHVKYVKEQLSIKKVSFD